MSIDPTARAILPATRDCAIQCLCSARDPLAAETARASLSSPAFDWDAFKQALASDRIAPLIHYRAGPWRLLPPALESAVRQAYLQTTWRNSLWMAELERLLLRFTAAGIPVIVLKGPSLLLTVYEKLGLRPMSDLDLLVHLPDLDRAKQILLDSGYTAYPAMYPSPYTIEYAFINDRPGQMTVEIHTCLFQVPHMATEAEMEWFWDNSLSVPLGQAALVRLLAPEAQVLHLCGHLWLHHRGGDLLGLNDIHEVICHNAAAFNASAFDWSHLFRAARSLDLVIPLQKVLPALAEEWRTPIPPAVLDELRAIQPTRREQRKFSRLWWQKYTFAELLLVDLLSLPTWRDRLRYTWCKLFPLPEFMRATYPFSSGMLLPFAYLYRWLTSIVRVRDG
jgi:hypothetical protein